jgi:hypothetical protein
LCSSYWTCSGCLASRSTAWPLKTHCCSTGETVLLLFRYSNRQYVSVQLQYSMAAEDPLLLHNRELQQSCCVCHVTGYVLRYVCVAGARLIM